MLQVLLISFTFCSSLWPNKHQKMLPATLVTIASFLLELCSSSPVYSMQPAYIIANIGTTGRNIRNLPCISRKTSEKGVCMFAIDCLKANGTHLGTCIDRFYFGSCCHVPPMHDIVGNTIDTAIIPVREPPSRLSSTTAKISTSSATTVEKTTSTPQISTTMSKTTVSAKIVPKPNVTVSVTSTIRTPTTTKPIKGFGERLTTKKATFTTTKSSSSAQPKPSIGSSINPQANVAETTEISYKLTTFQTVEENAINGEIATSTKPPKFTTVKAQTTSKSTISTKPTTSKPVPSSSKPKPPSTPFRPRPTHQKPTIRPRPPPSTIKPVKISKPTFKPLLTTTRTPIKPTKGTLKPVKLTTTKRSVISTKSTTTTAAPRTTRSTHRPVLTTTLTTTPKPSTTEKVASSQLPVSEKFTLLTELTTRPTTSKSTPSTTEFSTTKQPLSTQAPSVTERVSVTVPTTVSSTIAHVQATQSNDLPTVISVSAAVNGNLTTNEIEQVEPLQPPPTTEETNTAAFVTWTEETTTKVVTTPSPDWMPITTPDRWVPLPSLSTVLPGVTSTTSAALNNTEYNETTSQKPLETSSIMITTAPFNYFNENSSTVSSSTTMSTASTLPDASSTITNLIDVSSTTQTSVNMSDFTDVCGRRMYPEARIVGGERAAFGEWPWQISLRQWRTSTYLHKCGAALLNENWAITAAHCVDNVPPSDLLLRLGEHDLSTDNEPYIHQERRVQIVASHPQFDPRTFEYDLALLRFYEPVQFQPNIIPVCVPGNDDNFVGRTAYVTGWGRLYEDGPLPSVLQKVSVPVINNTVCESMYRSAGYIEHIPHIFICAGWRRGGFDSCEGDSGGPMVIQRPDKRFLLAGVISWGIGCAEPNQPGVYTRISEFRDWINQILQF